MTDPWQAQKEALGAFIRSQRKLANLSLRQLADLTSLSHPYLSQVERGLHLLDVMTPAKPDDGPPLQTEAAIRADQRLSEAQRTALIAVYRSMLDHE